MINKNSSVLLQEELVKAASIEGERFNRSTDEQIEFWVRIGRSVDGVIDNDVLIAVASGLANLCVEPK